MYDMYDGVRFIIYEPFLALAVKFRYLGGEGPLSKKWGVTC